MRCPNWRRCAAYSARRVVRRLRDPDRLRRDPDAAAVERRHRDREPLPLVVEQPVAPDAHAVDADVRRRRRVEAELLLLAHHRHLVAVEQEARDAARPRRALVGAREQHERAGVAAVRDPLLGPADHPAVAVRHRRGADRAGIRPEVGLGQGEGAEHLAARKPRHEARLLLVGAEGDDRQRRRARVHGDGDADAGVGAGQLLEREDVREEVGAGAAELLRHARPHQTEGAELPEHVGGEPVLPVPRRGVRGDLGVRELARQSLDAPLLVGEGEVHRPRV